MLTQSAALVCGQFRIRISELSSGPVMTPMLREFIEKSQRTGAPFSEASLIAASPIGKIATHEEITASVLFFCSPQALSITGAVLTIDNGFILAL